MPRRPDPTALTPKEARDLRALLRRLKAITGVTSEAMAEKLAWDVRRVTNALSETQTLLAKNAAALLKAAHPGPAHREALRLLNGYVADQRADHGWLARYEASLVVPSVFIPWEMMSYLSAFLSLSLAAVGAIPKTAAARNRLESGLNRVLRREARKMAMSWRAWQVAVAWSLIAGVKTGVHPLVNSKGDSILKEPRDRFAADLIALLVERAFLHHKGG
jgi:hypothetical protein